MGKKVCNAPRATDFREERNPPQADSIVSNSKLCTIQYCNITIPDCNSVPYYVKSIAIFHIAVSAVPPTNPHHCPVVPACPPPPSVDCRVIQLARRHRRAACCPAAPCRHHAARRSCCAFCCPAAPCRCCAARRRCVPPGAIVMPPIEVDCRVIGRCPPLFVAVAARPPPPAALLSRRHCLSLNRRAAAAIS